MGSTPESDLWMPSRHPMGLDILFVVWGPCPPVLSAQGLLLSGHSWWAQGTTWGAQG